MREKRKKGFQEIPLCWQTLRLCSKINITDHDRSTCSYPYEYIPIFDTENQQGRKWISDIFTQ